MKYPNIRSIRFSGRTTRLVEKALKVALENPDKIIKYYVCNALDIPDILSFCKTISNGIPSNLFIEEAPTYSDGLFDDNLIVDINEFNFYDHSVLEKEYSDIIEMYLSCLKEYK